MEHNQHTTVYPHLHYAVCSKKQCEMEWNITSVDYA